MSGEVKELRVDLGERSYPIYIGSGLLGDPTFLNPHIQGRQVMVVTNTTVGPLYLPKVLNSLVGYQTATLELPDGERYKSTEVWGSIFTRLLEARFGRRCTVIALGGGVVGDMAGFAAACYQRGVRFVQIPTTLLAQVDSSVGGKTGVNHPLGKNMIGAFYQPQCVIADTATLDTLDQRQLAAGIAEVIKYGLIDDPVFFEWLEERMESLMRRDPAALAFAIERSCADKARVVAADELESGRRALLNLGHTFGHAIETATGYGNWLHGEAVAAGMCMAARFSQRLGWISPDAADRAERLVERAGLPVRPPADIGRERFLELMAVDKKVLDDRLRLVLLKDLGNAVVTEEFDLQALKDTLDEYGASR